MPESQQQSKTRQRKQRRSETLPPLLQLIEATSPANKQQQAKKRKAKKPQRPFPSWFDQPTATIVSVSGGIDSAATAIWARKKWPDRPIILWHAYLAEMDWPTTPHYLYALADAIGNCTVVMVQAVYELTGELTPTGFNGTRLRRIHDVVRHGPATDDDSDAILTLLDFASRARLGWPPTTKNRYCTSYLKSQLFDAWSRTNRELLGDRPVLLSGERRAESPGRAVLPQWQWRLETKKWDLLWFRPVIELRFHEVVAMVAAAGKQLIHEGYFIQGETIEAMLDPTRDERGRARLSCRVCIFSSLTHIGTALRNAPEVMGPAVADIQLFEQMHDRTWQQRGPMVPCGV